MIFNNKNVQRREKNILECLSTYVVLCLFVCLLARLFFFFVAVVDLVVVIAVFFLVVVMVVVVDVVAALLPPFCFYHAFLSVLLLKSKLGYRKCFWSSSFFH